MQIKLEKQGSIMSSEQDKVSSLGKAPSALGNKFQMDA